MKKINIKILLLILVLTLSACSGGLINESQGDQDGLENEPMEFTEDEISESDAENEFEFTEDEVTENDPQPSLPENNEPAASVPEGQGEDPGMVFPEEDVESMTDETSALILPPAGQSTWEITHEDGTITCTTGTQNFGEGEIETIRIEANADLDFFILWNFEGNPDGILFTGYGKDNQITHYEGQLEIPGTDGELHFVVSFENPSGGTVATNMYGTISSEMQGCAVTRDFTGVLVD